MNKITARQRNVLGNMVDEHYGAMRSERRDHERKLKPFIIHIPSMHDATGEEAPANIRTAARKLFDLVHKFNQGRVEKTERCRMSSLVVSDAITKSHNKARLAIEMESDLEAAKLTVESLPKWSAIKKGLAKIAS